MKKIFTMLLVIMIFSLLLVSCAPPAEVADFFEGYNWQELTSMLFLVLFGLFPGFRLFNWLKTKLKIKDSAAHWMVVALSLLLTGLLMWFTGELSFDGFDFNLTNLIALGSFLYTSSQFAYQRFKNGVN